MGVLHFLSFILKPFRKSHYFIFLLQSTQSLPSPISPLACLYHLKFPPGRQFLLIIFQNTPTNARSLNAKKFVPICWHTTHLYRSADTIHISFAFYLTVQCNNVTVNLFRSSVQNILMIIKTKSLYTWGFSLDLFTTLSGTYFRNYFSAIRETIILYGMGNHCWLCTC